MNKKVLMKLGGKIMIGFLTLRLKTYFYLTDNGNNVKKAKETKKTCNKKNT